MNALVLDIDGTLADERGCIFTDVREALLEARNRIPIIIASARCPSAIAVFLDLLRMDCPFVALNGAAAFNSIRSQPVFALTIHPDGREALKEALRKQRVPPRALFGYDMRRWLAWGDIGTIRNEAQITGIPPTAITTADRVLMGGRLKVTLVYSRASAAQSGLSAVQHVAMDFCRPVVSKPTYVEVVSAATSKAVAIRRLLGSLGMRGYVAVGDGPNDIDLFSAASYSYAMPHSDDVVRLSADEVLAEPVNMSLASLIRRLSGIG